MPEISTHAPGTFCWVELATPDVAASKQFYATLLDWDYTDVPAGPMTYTLARRKGKDVAGVYELNAEMRAQGVPPHFMSHIASANVDETVAKAKSLGATIEMQPFDVMDVGRMAVVKDPQGAVFSVWQAKNHIGTGLLGEHGAMCWNELMTTDTAAAKSFYTSLFGWTAREQDMGPAGIYTLFLIGDKQVAGMMQISPSMGPIPPNWGVYFAVDDVDGRADKAKSGGAAIHVPPTDIPNIGRFSMIQDPQGSVVSIISLVPIPA